MKKVIATKNAPGAIGPYSQAIQAGDYLFCSGQIPLDPATGALAEGGIEAQTAQSLKNLCAILAEAGVGPEAVVKTTVFLQSMEDFAAMNAVYAKTFLKDCPGRSAVEVGALPKGALVEIEAIAYLK